MKENIITIIAYLDNGKSECGYRFVVKKDYTSWKAFKTVKGFKYFLDGYGLKINITKTELHDCRAMGHGRFITMECQPKKIDERYFWDASEIPENAKQYYSIVNGSYVNCYIISDTSTTVIYKPNPNASAVYIPYDYSTINKLIR